MSDSRTDLPPCQAIVATFAWFVARCGEPGPMTVRIDGEIFDACPSHGGAS